MTSNETNFLVVGGTGKTGRRVADRLRARNLSVRSASRGSEPPFEWADRTTWAPVLDDIDAVYLTYYPDLVASGAADDIRAFSRLAVAKGVRRLVLLSEPFIDVRDIADVAVEALTAPGHDGKLYELTGPRLLTFADAATEIAAASGRDVRYVPISAEEYAAAAVGYGVPEEEVAVLTELFARVLDGRNSSVTDGVERVLSRPATDFARDAAANGAWIR